MKKTRILKMTTLITSASAILELILSQIHISALYKLSNEICGIYMFSFVLFGLVSLFNTLRTNDSKSYNYYLSLVTLVICLVFGGLLMSVYFDAFNNQINLEKEPVIQSLIVLIIFMCTYTVSIVLLVLQKIFDKLGIKFEPKKKKVKEKKEPVEE